MKIDPVSHGHLCEIEVAAALVRGFVAGRSFEEYTSDDMLRSGVERQLQIIGAALTDLIAVDSDIADRLPEHDAFIAISEVLDDPFGSAEPSATWDTATKLLDPLADAATEMIEREEPVDGEV